VLRITVVAILFATPFSAKTLRRLVEFRQSLGGITLAFRNAYDAPAIYYRFIIGALLSFNRVWFPGGLGDECADFATLEGAAAAQSLFTVGCFFQRTIIRAGSLTSKEQKD